MGTIERIVFYSLLSVVGFIFLELQFISYTFVQAVLVFFFLIMIWYEAKSARLRFLLLPPAIFTIYSLLRNMLPGLSYFIDGGNTYGISVSDLSVVRGSWYTLVATQVMWAAFYALPASFAVGKLKAFGRGFVNEVPFTVIYTLGGLAALAAFLGLGLQAFGYLANEESNAFKSYIGYFSQLIYLAIVLVVIYNPANYKAQLSLALLISLGVIIGFVNGSKTLVVWPVIVLLLARLAVTGRLDRKWILVGIILIVAAWAIIEPFRAMYSTDRGATQFTSASSLFGAYFDSERTSSDVPLLSYLTIRMNYALPLAKAIEFADQTEYYKSDEWGHLVLAPVYAVAPRALFPDKPLADFGKWASVNIFGSSGTTSTGITPQGSAYLVFRLPGIIIFFILFGFTQKLFFNTFHQNHNLLPIYLLMYQNVGYPGDLAWAYFAGVTQSLVFYLPIMWLIIRFSRVTKCSNASNRSWIRRAPIGISKAKTRVLFKHR